MLSLILAAALSTIAGTINDNTTGQPLVNVNVDLANKHARTDSRGRFTLHGVRAGSYVLHMSSPDVPPQSVPVRVSGTMTRLKLHACSTTLDYSCGGGPGGG